MLRSRARSRSRNGSPGGAAYWYQQVKNVFVSGGYNGFILDALDQSTLNQVSTGTTPVTAVTQPIGWFGDKHLGMQLGPELSQDGNFTNWVNLVAAPFDTFTASSTSLSIANATEKVSAAHHPDSIAVVAGKAYKISVNVERTSGTYTIGVLQAGGGATYSSTANITTTGVVDLFVVAPSTENVVVQLTSRVGTGAQNFRLTSISVKLLDGNHPLQATTAARPSWQVDANGYHYAQLLGTDDSMSCATGGGGSTGFLLCCALKPTGGAGTLRTIYSDTGTNTGYKVQIDVNNKLSFSAGNGTAFTTKVSTAAFAVGTTYLLTCWDDGTSLNVQINSEAVETVARPVVVAGTAGYTLFKDNGAASSFAILDFYRADGIKDWAGTAAELAAIQSWVKAGAGL